VIGRCLAKTPDKRFPNVAELAIALRPFGPPGSDVSVERTTGVLAQAALPPGARAHPSRPPTNQRITPGISQPLHKEPTGPLELLPPVPPLTDEEQERQYLGRIGGDRSLVPQLAVDAHKLTGLSLDHRAGFLMSCIDGSSSIDDLLFVSGMSRLETLKLVCELTEQRVIVFPKQ